jgi:NAD dependent epimerase/dehydratase family
MRWSAWPAPRPGSPDAEVLAADALDPAAVQRAVLAAAPEVIVHMLTAIPDPVDPRHLARDMALSNRLRTSGTANLLAAADGARVIAQGIAHAYDPAGSPVKDEDAPLWRNPPRQFAPVVAAVRNMERRVTAAGGLVLRLGHLYGPGSSFDPDGGGPTRRLHAGRLPLVGDGASLFSFIHAHDVATAILAAVEHPAERGQRRRRPAHPGPRLAARDGGPARRSHPPARPGLAGPPPRRRLGRGLPDRPGRRRQRPRPPPAGLEAHLHQLASRPHRRPRHPSSPVGREDDACEHP